MPLSLIARISAPALHRVIRDIVILELQASRGRRGARPDAVGEEGFDLGPAGLDLDSLERFSLAARLNEFFALHETGLEDNLLRARTTGEMLEVVSASLRESARYVSFRTGGTTGSARSVRHEASELEQEVRELAELLADRRRVLLTVPSCHIYGFIFGVLLPEFLRVPVVEAGWTLLGGSARPRAGDLIVSVPFLWEQVLPAVERLPGEVWGMTSTAPLPEYLSRRLRESPLERLLEIYGSSETGGVGWRDQCRFSGDATEEERSFELFTFWKRWEGDHPHRLERVHSATANALRELPDRIRWTGERRFLPLGRRDFVVQVGGQNIDLEDLRRRILDLDLVPTVEECALRHDAPGERIRACLVSRRAPTDAEKEEAQRLLRGALGDAEIPGEITWLRELPRSAIGKQADWKLPSR